MSRDIDRPGVSEDKPAWQGRLGFYADALGIIGGLGFLMNGLWWWLSRPQHPLLIVLFFISVGVSVAFIFVFLLDRLLASHNSAPVSIGGFLPPPGRVTPPTKALTTRADAATQEHASDSPAGPQLAPNIICLPQDRIDSVELDRHQVFRESDYYGAGALRVIAAAFINAPKPPQKVGGASNVSAQIEFYNAEWPEREHYRVNYACWLNEESPYVSFGVGTVHHVIIGVFQHKRDGTSGFEPDFTIYGNSLDRNAPLSKFSDKFTEHYNIKVQLIIGEHGEFTAEHDFVLSNTPGQGFSFAYASKEQQQERKKHFQGELVKLIAKGEALVTTTLVKVEWDKLHEDIREWANEVSTLVAKYGGRSLMHRFLNVSKLRPYPHKIPEGRRRYFDELYTKVENLKEIAREWGAGVPPTDVSKQIEKVTKQRREKIAEGLEEFAAKARGLIEEVESKARYLPSEQIRKLYIWDVEIFDYLTEYLDRADTVLTDDAAFEGQTPTDGRPDERQRFISRIRRRLEHVNLLVDDVRSGRRAV